MRRIAAASLLSAVVSSAAIGDARADATRRPRTRITRSAALEVVVRFFHEHLPEEAQHAKEALDKELVKAGAREDEPDFALALVAQAYLAFKFDERDAGRQALTRAATTLATAELVKVARGKGTTLEGMRALVFARDLMDALGDVRGASALADVVVATRERLACDPLTVTDAQLVAARYARELGASAKAAALYDRVEATFEAQHSGISWSPKGVELLRGRAALLLDKADVAGAAALYDRALERAGRHAVLLSIATADMHVRAGNYARAATLYDAATEGTVHARKDVAAVVHAKYALYLEAQGRPGDAQRSYAHALELLNGLENEGKLKSGAPRDVDIDPDADQCNLGRPRTFVDDMHVWASVDVDVDRPMTSAASQFETEYDYYVPSANNVSIARAALGSFAARRGDLSTAERMLRAALDSDSFTRGPSDVAVAIDRNNLGALYFDELDYEHAVPLFEQARDALEAKPTERARLALVLNNLAVAYDDVHDAKTALPLHERALALYLETLGPNHPETATALYNAATAYRDTDDLSRAQALDLRALSIRTKTLGESHPQVAASLEHIGTLAALRGDASAAVDSYSKAADAREKALALVLGLGSDAQRVAYVSAMWRLSDAAVTLGARTFPENTGARRLALTTVLRRKGRALDASIDQSAAIRGRLDDAGRATLKELDDARASLASLVLLDARRGARRDDAIRLEERIRDLEGALARKVDFGAARIPPTIAAVQSALPRDAALVEMVLYRPFQPRANAGEPKWLTPRYAAFVLHREGDPGFIDLGEASPIDDAIAALRTALADPRSDTTSSARTVDRLVMEPLVPAIADAARVFVSPDGAIDVLPFGALLDSESHVRIEQYAFSYLTSGRDLLRPHAPAQVDPGAAAIFLGAPDFGDRAPPVRGASLVARAFFPPLAEAAREVETVSARWSGARLFVGAQAKKQILASIHSPSILHLATHGFALAADDDIAAPSVTSRGLVLDLGARTQPPSMAAADLEPLTRAGLAFAGANGHDVRATILTALEAASLDLSGTRLVVLSACETGLGEVRRNDGVFGLRRAFALAGAQSLVTSLWSVDDAATRDLMVDYYARLRAGGGRADSLREAQLAMLRRTATRHPFFWASFIAIGDPTTLDGREVPIRDITRPHRRADTGVSSRGCVCDSVGVQRVGFGPSVAAIVLAFGLWTRRSHKSRS